MLVVRDVEQLCTDTCSRFTVIGNGTFCTAWKAGSCYAITDAHCVKPDSAGPIESKITFESFDGVKFPVDVVAVGDRQKNSRLNDYALLRFRNARTSAVRNRLENLGSMQFDTTNLHPETVVDVGGNYCTAGYSTDIPIGKDGTLAAMDPGVLIVTLEKDVPSAVFHTSAYIYRVRANSYTGGSGGPLFSCPIDKSTGKADLKNPVVWGN